MSTAQRLAPEPPVLLDAPPLAAARTIAGRLARPDVVAAAVEQARRTSRNPFGWGGASLHAGPAGSALVLRRMSRLRLPTAETWAEAARAELVRAVRSTAAEPLTDAGLSGGTAGVALALCDALRDDHRYAEAVRSIAARLADQVLGAPPWPTPGAGLGDGDYDVVTGSSGAVVGLLAVLAAHDPRARVAGGCTTDGEHHGGVLPPGVAARSRAALHRAVTDLVAMCTPAGEHGRVPWVLDPRRYPAREYLDSYPHGYVNLGFAHGLPGVLAALSLALQEQPDAIPVDRATIAMQRIVELIETARTDDAHGPNWPSGLRVDATGESAAEREGATRTAWCYGAPGIALALLHAGRALGDDELLARAVSAFDGVVSRVSAHGSFGSGTVCHGAAGVLLVGQAFARSRAAGPPDAGADRWAPALALLTDRVLAHVDPGLPLGVQDWDQEAWLDDPGLLTGAAGTAAVLAGAAGGDDEAIGRAFLAW